jgi:hypothetical protein
MTVGFPLEFPRTPNFREPIEEAKIRERTHEPLSATHGIAEPIFRHRRLPTGKRWSRFNAGWRLEAVTACSLL